MRLCVVVIFALLALTAVVDGRRKKKQTISDDLIRAWAPQIVFHPQEEFFPASVEYGMSFMNYYSNGRNLGQVTPANIDTLSPDTNSGFLTSKQSLGSPSDSSLAFFKGQAPSSNPPIYAIVVPKSGGITDVFYFQYYTYNRGKRVCIGRFVKTWGIGCVGGYSVIGNHVSDWEHFTVRFTNGQPTHLYLSQHDHGDTFNLNTEKSKLKWVSGHPVLYSAVGSHGLYRDAARHTYKVLPNDDLNDDTGNGAQWNTWNNVKIIRWVQPGQYTGENKWMNFLGRWGNSKQGCGNLLEKVAGECLLNDGPTGPASKGWITSLELN